MRVLIVDREDGASKRAADLLRKKGWKVRVVEDYRSAGQQVIRGDLDVVLVTGKISDASTYSSMSSDPGDSGTLRRMLEAGGVAAVMLTDPDAPSPSGETGLVDYAPADAAPENIVSRLSTVARYHRQLRRIESELDSMRRLGKRLNEHFTQIDQEMRLASRLQRDFLPRLHEPIQGIIFRALFRPASWVSGDIYDVVRVDEHHIACYVADAVGHGMAAGLLTIFIKQAVIPKRIENGRYDVLEPGQTLALLNDALAAQSLPNAQFVTACYVLLDTRTLRLRYARAGHPYPLLLGADGQMTELKATGGLLGVFPGEAFVTEEVQLHPGDKVLLYTDGFEMAFQPDGRGTHMDTRAYMRRFEEYRRLPLSRMIQEIEGLLNADVGSLSPRDDATLVGFEIPRHTQPLDDLNPAI